MRIAKTHALVDCIQLDPSRRTQAGEAWRAAQGQGMAATPAPVAPTAAAAVDDDADGEQLRALLEDAMAGPSVSPLDAALLVREELGLQLATRLQEQGTTPAARVYGLLEQFILSLQQSRQ